MIRNRSTAGIILSLVFLNCALSALLTIRASADDRGAPIACTIQGMSNARLVYVPEDRVISLRWSVVSHDGSRREVAEPIVDDRHASGSRHALNTCQVTQKYDPPAHGRSAGYFFSYDCGNGMRGELATGDGTSNALWTERQLNGGFVDRKDYTITRCW